MTSYVTLSGPILCPQPSLGFLNQDLLSTARVCLYFNIVFFTPHLHFLISIIMWACKVCKRQRSFPKWATTSHSKTKKMPCRQRSNIFALHWAQTLTVLHCTALHYHTTYYTTHHHKQHCTQTTRCLAALSLLHCTLPLELTSTSTIATKKHQLKSLQFFNTPQLHLALMLPRCDGQHNQIGILLFKHKPQ